MALKTWKREESTLSQLGDILFKFLTMMLMKIIVWLFIKKTTAYISKIYKRWTESQPGANDAEEKKNVDKNSEEAEINDEMRIKSESLKASKLLERFDNISSMNKTTFGTDVSKRIKNRQRRD